MTQFDQETTEQLTKAQALDAMFASTGWQHAEADLLELIAELKDISSIDLDSDVQQQIRDRKNLAEGLLEWVESLKSQVSNGIMVVETTKSNLIVRR